MTAVGADLKRAFEPWTDDSLKRWSPLSFPAGDGGTWTWAEPDARVRAHGGRLEIRVERFTRSHDVVQIFDNPKHLLGCKDVLAIPDHGIEIETSLGGETLRAPEVAPSPTDYVGDIDAGFYVSAYLRSWAFEAQMRDHLRERFGNDWFTKREAGGHLRELWSEGQKPTADALLQDVTGSELDLEAVAVRIRESLG